MAFHVVISLIFALANIALAGDPFLVQHGSSWVIGNIWNVTIGLKYGRKLWYKGNELVGAASGHYVSYSMPFGCNQR
jgi:rhamnogalacturonan endolyase